MTPHSFFPIPNTVAALCWLILLLAPLSSAWPRRIAVATVLALALTYAGLIGAFISQGTGDFQSLAGVARLFEHPGLLLAGWLHYLAFDLLIGLWEREEAARIGLARGWLLPCQLLTFMFGPIGWLAFMAARGLRLRGGRSSGAGGPSPRVLAL
jgi:hypothetical protein